MERQDRANEQFSLTSVIALPGIFFWELSLGAYLVVKGFRPSAPILAAAPALITTDATTEAGVR